MSATTTVTTPSNESAIQSDISTVSAVAEGVAAAVPGGAVAIPAIAVGAGIADLILHMSTMYSQKTLTEAQLIGMVKIAVSDFNQAEAAWNAAK